MDQSIPPRNAMLSVLTLLARSHSAVFDRATDKLQLVQADGVRRYTCKPKTLNWLCQQDLITCQETGEIQLTRSAKSWMQRNGKTLDNVSGFRSQHDHMAEINITDPDGLDQTVCAVDPESPLAWLMARKDKDGTPFLSEAHYTAGERLRREYDRAALNPRLGMNWSPGSTSSKAGAKGVGELHDVSLDARDRVNDALTMVGPELAGPLLDVCCYLQKLSEVEKARGWPARSGKLILKLSLEALARHYGLLMEAHGAVRSNNIRHAGTQDYRPNL